MSRIFHALCGALLLAALAANFVLELWPGIEMDARTKLCFATAIALLWTLYRMPRMATPTKRRRWLGFLFLYYLWLLTNVLFFDGGFGREAGARPQYSPGELYELFRVGGVAEGVSMLPLRTIRNYLSAYGHGTISRELMVLNLGGNLIAFAPMGLFLPALYGKQRNLFCFALTVSLLVVGVEVIQAAIGCGSADVDDFLLNFTGAVVTWLVLWFPTGWLYRWLRLGPRRGCRKRLQEEPHHSTKEGNFHD